MRFLRRIITLSLILAFGVASGYAYDEIEVKDGGTITGNVKFTGKAPKFEMLPVTKNEDFCGKQIKQEVLVVGKGGALKYAVAYLENIDKGKSYDRAKQTDLNQQKCIFTPHVFAMMKGTELATTNSDPILHNANMEVRKKIEDGDADGMGIQMFNFGQPQQNMSYVKRVRKEGAVKVTCDSHTHMLGYFISFEHPYFAVSDDDGNFTIDNIPPGKYTLKVWHESWKQTGWDADKRPIYDRPVILSKEIEVKAKGTEKVQLEFK